tara:strand:- start:469 stop:3207 length:2739 start_codon:yes stop_codon:yes gene_type:complete
MELKKLLQRLSQNHLHIAFPEDSSEEAIEQSVRFNSQAPNFSSLTEEDIQEVILKIQEIEGIDMDICSTIEDDSENFEEWLTPERKLVLNDGYWSNYKNLLSKKGSFSDNVITTIGLDTDRIISKCGDPNPTKNNTWDRKGLVIGSVQSGKTANYIALITKAADLGYKVIIVIAGRDNNLREQTQKRINDGFIKPKMIINDVKEPVSITGKFDFDTPALDRLDTLSKDVSKDEKPVVAVIKKNTNVLNNIKSYFIGSKLFRDGKINLPMILIDDEADNASINTRYSSDNDDPTKINKDIREILNIFTKSSYIGYTATPFANIFIDPDDKDEMIGGDLFPKNFITRISPPTNYFGPKKIFLDDDPYNSNTIEKITDNEDYIPLKHKKVLEPKIPKSLKEAIIAFYLVNAIFYLRDIFDSKDVSMMINVSLFTSVQEQLKLEITREKDRLDNLLRHNLFLENEDAKNRLKIFEDVFIKYYSNNIKEKWPDVKNAIKKTYLRIEIKSINQESSDPVEYKDGDPKIKAKSYMVIGGHSLSRGFTVHGLAITYILRNTQMCDTLLQMGRWFGYRDGYEDLCKIWMTLNAIDFYQFIAEEVNNIGEQVKQMERLKKSPLEFGLMVRDNPLSLHITALNKMGVGQKRTINVSLSSRFIETTTLPKDKNILKRNFDLSKKLINDLSLSQKISVEKHHGLPGLLFKEVSINDIEDFICEFVSRSPLTNPIEPIIKYINDRSDELSSWDVFVTSPRKKSRYAFRNIKVGDISIGTSGRQLIIASDDKIKFANGKISGRYIEKVGLSELAVENEINKWRDQNRLKILKNEIDKDGYPDSIFRVKGRKPLLVLHFIDLFKDTDSLRYSFEDNDFAHATWSISFPPTKKHQEATQYFVNKTWRQMNFFDNLESNELIELKGSDGS